MGDDMFRMILLAGAALQASGAHAAQEDSGDVADIVVTGSRSGGRAALESSAPIDVVSGQKLTSSGFPDLGRALNFLQPSVNFARAATTASVRRR